MFQIPFLGQLRSIVSASPIDDFVDIISCFATAAIFLFGAILISAKTYVGSPIQCWLPQTYSSSWEEYVETYCFLKNTYFVGSNADINNREAEQVGVPYYQWASMYLTVMALCFVIPKMFWKKSQAATGIPLLYFCETTNEIKSMLKEQRDPKIREMATLMINQLNVKHLKMNIPTMKLTTAYWTTKHLYLLNLVFQFVALSHFLGQGHEYDWGVNLLINLINGRRWYDTGVFPRVTYCNFDVRAPVGNDLQDHVVQCVLGVNEFNEKIFLFIFFWLLFACLVTMIGCLFILWNEKKTTMVYDLLSSLARNDDTKQFYLETREFSTNFLKPDGVLILLFIEMHSDVVAQEVAIQLFQHFLEHREEVLRRSMLESVSSEKVVPEIQQQEKQ